MWLINGTPADTVHASDRGLHFGDGLFETMALVGGRVRFLDYHLDRLASGCKRLRMLPPDKDLVRDEIRQLARGRERAVVKLIVTRGRGGRGYAVSEETTGTRILSLHPWPDAPAENYSDGVTVRWCETPVSTSEYLGGIKHLNRLDQVLARAEWNDPAIAEGLMLDGRGCVIEGTCSNVFFVTGNQIVTPTLDAAGVEGVMRRVVIETAIQMDRPVTERDVTADELDSADELFLTNSLSGIWPVCRLDANVYSIGPVTRSLMENLTELGVRECAA